MSAATEKPSRRGGGKLRAITSVEVLLPLACLASALVLGFSELLTTFELTPPGGDPLQVSEAGDRHSYALMVLAVFALFSLALAVLSGSKPAAFAVATAGALALLIFLLADLPDAGKIGTLDDPRQSFIDAEAVPQAGFWLELLGALSLAVSGAALATLTPEQLALRERFGWRLGRPAEERPADEGDEEREPKRKRRREKPEKAAKRAERPRQTRND